MNSSGKNALVFSLAVGLIATCIPTALAAPGSPANEAVKCQLKKKDGDAEKALDWTPYITRMQNKIRDTWLPPRGTESYKPLIRYTVYRDGRMSKAHFVKATDISKVDRTAMKALKKAAPFDKLPEGAAGAQSFEILFDKIDMDRGDIVIKATAK